MGPEAQRSSKWPAMGKSDILLLLHIPLWLPNKQGKGKGRFLFPAYIAYTGKGKGKGKAKGKGKGKGKGQGTE